MKLSHRIAIVAALLAAIAGVFAFKSFSGSRCAGCAPAASAQPAAPVSVVSSQPLPRLLDLGANKCLACKMMVPVLEALKKEQAGALTVDFIDVWQNPEAGRLHGVQMIPTQIFYDAAGKELFRHTGFLSKEDILKKWKELGVDLAANRDKKP
ncbi:MAG: hypothetical protein B9S32_16785 [Verrucomicrobia bacterium Tous-C9LFEB]|nr:MAG: hypothetical protein B9S32_16785 [Verrucomicrobia bacterium Tous-C9LFEB]